MVGGRRYDQGPPSAIENGVESVKRHAPEARVEDLSGGTS